MTMPSVVLTSASASAPAVTTECATATMSVTSGDSLTITGTPGVVARRTAATTPAAATGSHAKTWPRLSTFGHEMLTSTALTPSELRSRCASLVYSSTVPPAIDTIARAPR